MNSEAEVPRRECPFCREPMHAEAYKCPHCLQFIRVRFWSGFYPLFAALPALVAIFGGLYWLSRIAGEPFDSHRPQVRPVETELQLGEAPAGPTVGVIGLIVNESAFTWKRVSLEVQFFDADRKLIETRQRNEYLELPAKTKTAFRISQPRELAPENYVSCEVRVLTARDAAGFSL